MLYDILRKLQSNSKVEVQCYKVQISLSLLLEIQNLIYYVFLQIIFHYQKRILAKKILKFHSQKLLRLLNKTKISISNDETRHYLNGIYLHKIQS